MSMLVAKATCELRAAVGQAIEKAQAAGELPQAQAPEIALEVPGDRAHGDWACNAAMAGARAFKMLLRARVVPNFTGLEILLL